VRFARVNWRALLRLQHPAGARCRLSWSAWKSVRSCEISISSLRPPNWVTDHWDTLVAAEVSRQGDIEAAFDRADGYERLGDPRLALKWLDQARELSGGLSPAGSAQRARLARALEGADR
jgi:hypothetical protein